MLGLSVMTRAERLHVGEVFCRGLEMLPRATGIVRLHPSESLAAYAELIARHPSVRFVDNRQVTLDEAMAATDAVVVHNSGLGSDALVKRRLTAVIDSLLSPLGHGRELVEEAGCPRVTSPEELSTALEAMLFDEAKRNSYRAAAERYETRRFCAYFGRESARQIARTVENILARGPAEVFPHRRPEEIAGAARNEGRHGITPIAMQHNCHANPGVVVVRRPHFRPDTARSAKTCNAAQGGVRLYGLPHAGGAQGGKIVLGNRVSLRSRTAANALVSQPCVLCTMRDDATIEIGEDAGLSERDGRRPRCGYPSAREPSSAREP